MATLTTLGTITMTFGAVPPPRYRVGRARYRTMYGAAMAAKHGGATKKRLRKLRRRWQDKNTVPDPQRPAPKADP